jgi:hypothetical protein
MAAATRAFRLIITVGALVASGMIAVASDAHAAPPAGSPPPWFGKGKATQAHLSRVLDRVARPAVAAGSAKAQAAAAGTPASGPGSLLRADSAHLRVDIRVDATDPATLSALSAAGARVTFVSAASHTVTAAVKPVDLVKVGSVAGVQYVAQIYTPMTAATCPSGAIVSEGDANTQLNTATARTHYGIAGTGVTVGVLSDSFAKRTSPTSAAGDVTTADLPGTGNTCGHTTPVNVADDSVPLSDGPEDEGRAMAQTVHDLAPGANLAFRTAFTGEEQFASNIKALATSGAKVIVDDVTYFDEPMYQDGILSNAVTSVTNSGVSYFSSAANSNVVDGSDRDIGSYEATGGYRPTACPAAFTGTPYSSCHNFSTSGTDNTYGMSVKSGGDVAIDLQWAQPISGVTSDFDVYLLDSSGNLLLDDQNLPVAGFDDNLQSQHPFEVLQWHNPGGATNVQLVIAQFPTGSSATPRFKFIDLENGSGGITAVDYNTSVGGDVVGPTIFGHNGAANAGTVAAVPYNDPNTPEDYSSRGPVTLLLGPVNGTTPAAPLGSPQVLAKPDFAATDCVQNTFFGQFFDGNWRFCGTSDAAPHAAGVAALLRSQGLSPTPAQMRSVLASTAATVTNGSTASTGAGRLDADAAGHITTTTVAPTPAATTPGTNVTITATVQGFGATPTGTVAFADGATSLGSASVDGSGHASVSTTSLAVGNRSITATYTPSDTHLGSSGTANVAIDNTPPVASVSEPAHLFAATRAITVRYSATDTISGVANYDVQRRIAPWNGGFSGYTTIRSHVTATTQTFTGTLGNEYCFRVIAYDKAGNASAPTIDHCVVVPLDDRSLSTATSGWTRSTSSAAFAGTTTRTTTAGARLSLGNAHVDRIALIVTQCSTCGRVTITLNGVAFKTVSTVGSTTHYKVVIVEPPFSLRTTTIGLKAVDSGKNLIIDALSIART